MTISPYAGKPPQDEMLADIPKLISAYYTETIDPSDVAQKVSFGTSGHRGSSLKCSFNEPHILAITQAICQYRASQHIDGPMFIGMDTHALSLPAWITALEVLAANQVEVMIAGDEKYTPTPAVSHAILQYNNGRASGLADGIVITPSHNPPGDGGFKYNPADGGPAGTTITRWIGDRANAILLGGLHDVKRIPYVKALHSSTTHRYDYLHNYVNDLASVIDMDVIRNAKISIGVDPLGGAGIHYWEPLAEKYGLNLTLVNKTIDPTFRFMAVDWDGQIRMDPSSAYAMTNLVSLKDKFDIAVACDTDYDRHGIVTKAGLLPPNHYLSVMAWYLFRHRPGWPVQAMIGKTVVSSKMIDKVASSIERNIFEVPVGFKWYAEGLLSGKLAFVGEESAGASFAKINGSVWTTDKDGITAALLAAEITATMQKDPGLLYGELEQKLGTSYYDRTEAAATASQKDVLKKISADKLNSAELAGEKIISVITMAPGNQESIEGVKVSSENGWFAARPSGTEDIYKIYAESFLSEAHLHQIQQQAQSIVDAALQQH
jgi:phosphoglucomutase